MIRALFLALALLLPGAARAATWTCTGSAATDTAGINALLAAGGTIHISGARSHCAINGVLTIGVNGTFVYGDGPANIPVTDSSKTSYSPYAQKVQAASGPVTYIDANIPAMTATPFDGIDITASNVYIGYLTIDLHWNSIAAVNNPGVPSHNGDGIHCLQASANVLLDHVDIENAGGNGFDNQQSTSCGMSKSVVNNSWLNSAYVVGSSPSKPAVGSYILDSVLQAGSQANIPGAPGTGWDGYDCDPNHTGCTITRTTLLGNDILFLAHPNHVPAQVGSNDTSYQNYSDNTMLVPACGSIGFTGAPTLGEVIGITVTATTPTPVVGSPATYNYTVTSADMAAGNPLGSVMTHIAAVMNASQITLNGVPMIASAYPNISVPAIEFNAAGLVGCAMTSTYTDSLAPSGLIQTAFAAGNGGGDCDDHSGVVGPYWDVDNVCYVSRNYCSISGGPNVQGHIVGNLCIGSTNTAIKFSNAAQTGAGDNGQAVGGAVLGNHIYSPDALCPTCIGVLMSFSATCGSIKFTGTPQVGDVISTTVNLTNPAATKYNPQTTNYTVVSGDTLQTVAQGIAALMQAQEIQTAGPNLAPAYALIGTTPYIRFSLSAAQLCSETSTYSATGGHVVETPQAGTSTAQGAMAWGNVGGTQIYPATLGGFFWGIGNIPGNYP